MSHDASTTAHADSLARAIRTRLAERHDAIERLPFAEALVKGPLDPLHYVLALHQLRHLHRLLESALNQVLVRQPEALGDLYNPSAMERTETLNRDLAFWNQHGATNDGPPRPHPALDRFAQWLERIAVDQPHALLGALYVVEGSRMGSMLLTNSLVKLLHTDDQPGHGLDYHAEGRVDRPAIWSRFKAGLDQFAATQPTSHREAIQEAAAFTMDTLFEIYRDLPVPQPTTTNPPPINEVLNSSAS